jgi:hypothetical protein
MKKFLTFVFALSIVFYLSNVSIAQSRGTGQGPAVSGAHIPDTSHSSSDHGKSADHANTTQGQTHSTSQANFMDRITSNQKLTDRLTDLLPGDWKTAGMTLTQAADGFKNQGQFIAFLHVSKNLGLTYMQWTEMRDKLATGKSLGSAIHDVKPDLSQTQINVQVQTAEQQAKDDQKIKTTS